MVVEAMADNGGGQVIVAVEVEDTPWCATGSELVADRLFALGASAVSELADDDGGTSSLRLVADLPADSLDRLAAAGLRFELLEIDPTWDDGWREHARAVCVGERLVVRPEWVDPAGAADGDGDSDRVEVVVDAADSFGSGSHATTRLCLEAIERIVGPGDRVLDIGSGTGVLGVAALLLGAETLVAIDVDPNAVAATRRTAELNGAAGQVVEASGRSVAEVAADHGPFDLVLANLLVPIIEELGPEMVRSVASGGRIVLSGLLDESGDGTPDGDAVVGRAAEPTQVDRAIVALGPGFGAPTVERDGGWVVVLSTRN